MLDYIFDGICFIEEFKLTNEKDNQELKFIFER
jgi:hypothetical protein